MKKLGLFKSLVLLLTLTFGVNAFSAIVVGKVDIQKILLSINEGKAVRKKLKKVFDEKQKILKKDEARIKKMQADFQKQSLVMNAKAKAKKEREIQGQMIKLQQRSQSFQKEIQGMELKLKKPILDKVRKIITKVSSKAKVDLTFEVSTAPVLYARTEKDLTPEIIKLYNKEHK